MSKVSGVNLKLGQFHLNVPDFEILDHGITLISGPSGSGKTTLFRILIGLQECKGFQWIMNGTNLADLSVANRRLGVLFQGSDLFPNMTALKNIELAAKSRGLDEAIYKNKLQELIQKLNLSPCIHTKSNLLSGGEAQRVALARALIGQPRLLLLDEPFSALDEELKQSARDLLKKIILDQQIPCLLISHDPRDKELSDKIIYLGSIKG